VKGAAPLASITNLLALESVKTTAQRLNTVRKQLLASKKREEGPDSQVLRSVVVNFHKKPVEERLNEVMHKL
jgi:hypothetical protein